MSVREFDRDLVDEIVARLSALDPDKKPRWGAMKAGELVPHLVHSMLWSMGRREAPPYTGNWVTRRVVGPLVLRGWIPIPKNVKIKIPAGSAGDGTDSLDDLKHVLADYLQAVETGDIKMAWHPMFGDIGIDGWARLHAQHFEHHFKQFDL